MVESSDVEKKHLKETERKLIQDLDLDELVLVSKQIHDSILNFKIRKEKGDMNAVDMHKTILVSRVLQETTWKLGQELHHCFLDNMYYSLLKRRQTLRKKKKC